MNISGKLKLRDSLALVRFALAHREKLEGAFERTPPEASQS